MMCLKLEEEVLISFFTSNDDVTYVLYSGGSRTSQSPKLITTCHQQRREDQEILENYPSLNLFDFICASELMNAQSMKLPVLLN